MVWDERRERVGEIEWAQFNELSRVHLRPAVDDLVPGALGGLIAARLWRRDAVLGEGQRAAEEPRYLAHSTTCNLYSFAPDNAGGTFAAVR